MGKILDAKRLGYIDRMIEDADVAWFVNKDDLPPVERRFYPRSRLEHHHPHGTPAGRKALKDGTP